MKLKEGKTEVGFDGSGQALFCIRLKEVVVAAVVQHGVDTCQDERMTDVLKVGEKWCVVDVRKREGMACRGYMGR